MFCEESKKNLVWRIVHAIAVRIQKLCRPSRISLLEPSQVGFHSLFVFRLQRRSNMGLVLIVLLLSSQNVLMDKSIQLYNYKHYTILAQNFCDSKIAPGHELRCLIGLTTKRAIVMNPQWVQVGSKNYYFEKLLMDKSSSCLAFVILHGFQKSFVP